MGDHILSYNRIFKAAHSLTLVGFAAGSTKVFMKSIVLLIWSSCELHLVFCAGDGALADCQRGWSFRFHAGNHDDPRFCVWNESEISGNGDLQWRFVAKIFYFCSS